MSNDLIASYCSVGVRRFNSMNESCSVVLQATQFIALLFMTAEPNEGEIIAVES